MFEKLAKLRFQFYLSSIKSSKKYPTNRSQKMFQFYLSSIKSQMPNQVPETFQSFNSTLVQLKGNRKLIINQNNLCFNSTLVQLKAVKNANKYTSKSMIYHPFILIFYKHLQSTFNS